MLAPLRRARVSISRWKSLMRVPALRAKLAVTAGARRENALDEVGQRSVQRLARRVNTYFSHPGASTFIIGSALNTVSTSLAEDVGQGQSIQRSVPVLHRVSVP